MWKRLRRFVRARNLGRKSVFPVKETAVAFKDHLCCESPSSSAVYVDCVVDNSEEFGLVVGSQHCKTGPSLFCCMVSRLSVVFPLPRIQLKVKKNIVARRLGVEGLLKCDARPGTAQSATISLWLSDTHVFKVWIPHCVISYSRVQS